MLGVLGTTRTDRRRGKKDKRSSQYEVIMTMKLGMGVLGGCAMQEKTVHDQRVNGMDPEHEQVTGWRRNRRENKD